MQTFLPFASFHKSATVLDDGRLGNQVKECMQITTAITVPDYGWQHHPAVCMWRGHYAALVVYGLAMYREWQRRYDCGERGGKRNHRSGEQLCAQFEALAGHVGDDYAPPPWLGDERLHSSHRGCLLAKDYEHYSRFGWVESPTPPVDGKWPYWWPRGVDVAVDREGSSRNG